MGAGINGRRAAKLEESAKNAGERPQASLGRDLFYSPEGNTTEQFTTPAAKGKEMITLEIEREADGRWIAEFPHMPGCLVYGDNRLSAVVKAAMLLEELEGIWINPSSTNATHGGNMKHYCKECKKKTAEKHIHPKQALKFFRKVN